MKKDYYKILGATSNDDQTEIRSLFRQKIIDIKQEMKKIVSLAQAGPKSKLH